MKSVMLLCAMTSLQGCVGVALYGASRGEVRKVAMPIVAERRPDLDPAGATDCVVKGMTVEEVFTVANNNIEARTAGDVAKVEQVMARPAVATCLAAVPKRPAKS